MIAVLLVEHGDPNCEAAQKLLTDAGIPFTLSVLGVNFFDAHGALPAIQGDYGLRRGLPGIESHIFHYNRDIRRNGGDDVTNTDH